MTGKEIIILATNLALLAALGAALVLGKIDMQSFLTAVGLLVMPSAAGMMLGKAAPAPPPAGDE